MEVVGETVYRVSSRGYLEELLWDIANALALEEHLVDDEELRRMYPMARLDLRENLVRELQDVCGGELARHWCVLKHLLLVVVHTLELASAVVHKPEVSDEDVDRARRYLELSKRALDMAVEVAKLSGCPV